MLLLNVALMATALSPAIPTKELTLERIFADPPLEGRTPMALGLSPDGRFLTFLKPNDKDSDVLDLWGASLPDGAPKLLVATADLLAGSEQKLTEAEKMALERKRITKKGITSYLWCGKDSTGLVFPLSGDLYHASIAANGAEPVVTRLTNDDEPELNPKCSKDGAFIAFTKKGDVHVLDRKTKKSRAITKGGSATRTFGLAEFIAEEEMGRHDGLWWSPDSKRVLVMEVDESKVGVKVRAQIFADRTETFEQRYPAAGEANAVVTAWVFDVATGKKVKLQTPTEDGYFPRAGFFQDGAAWIQWQSRDQRRLKLFEANASGVLRPILEETDAAWVDLHDDLEDLHTVMPGKLLWSSERSGRRQLYVVDRKSGALTALTNEPEPVLRVLAVDDAGTVFYTAARDRGRQAHVLAMNAETPATARALTSEPGMHTATFDDAGKFFVHRHAKPLSVEGSLGTPPTTTVRDATGKHVMSIDGEVPPDLATIAAMPHTFLDLKADDGSIMNGVLFEPAQLAANKGKKYPVIAYVYGGPTGHMVQKGWGRGIFMTRYWTQRGFGVFFIDNRGMGARDRDFARAHHQRFGDVEVKDLFDATRQMAAQTAWVDAKKLGVFGWSYGGYLAARAALDDNTPFAAHVGVAPVTDWTLYDTHYTERYVGVPKLADGKNNETYVKSNLVTRARLLSKPLLLVHGTADDNVLFEHTLRLTEALQKEGKVFDLMIYPGKAHGISGKPAQLHVYKTITTFFEAKLRP